MYLVFGIIYLALESWLIANAFRRPSITSAFLATVSLFSIGYMQLPILFRGMTTLQDVDDTLLSQVVGMELLFFTCVVAGVWLADRRKISLGGIRLRVLDGILTRHWWVTTIVAAGLYLAYLSTADLTSYASEDYNAFFEDRSALTGVLSFFSGMSLAVLALNLVIAFQRRRWYRFGFVALLFALIEGRLVQGAQRLLFIEPLFMIFACFVGLKQYRTAFLAIATGVAALVLVSPFAVALREARAAEASAQTSVSSFSYGSNPLETLLQSILDRADLIYVSTRMKDYVDLHGYVGSKYYLSVLEIPIPRALYPDKPYALSDTGDMHGEASVLAWHIVVGNQIGSLTQFGAIVAYREGGWIAVILDGFAAGLLFGVALNMFSRGGYIAHIFLPIAFVNWSVRKVPPSFSEAMVDVMTYVPIFAGLYLLAAVLSRGRRTAPSLAGAGPRANR
jgi:hypothetical protein